MTVVQFERIQDPRTPSQFLTADSVWEAEMYDSCAVWELQAPAPRSQVLTADSVWEAEMYESYVI